MSESYVDKVANELADLALADQAASGDIAIVDQIGEVLGASSQILQETYMTAIRVRRAEARARALLSSRKKSGYAAVAQKGDEKDDISPIETSDESPKKEAAPKASADEAIAAEKFQQAEAAAKAEAEARKATTPKKSQNAEHSGSVQAVDTNAISGPWDLDGSAQPSPATVPPAQPRRVKR